MIIIVWRHLSIKTEMIEIMTLAIVVIIVRRHRRIKTEMIEMIYEEK